MARRKRRRGRRRRRGLAGGRCQVVRVQGKKRRICRDKRGRITSNTAVRR